MRWLLDCRWEHFSHGEGSDRSSQVDVGQSGACNLDTRADCGCLAWELQPQPRTFYAARQEVVEAANVSQKGLAVNGAGLAVNGTATHDSRDLAQRMGAVSLARDPDQLDDGAASDSAVASTGKDPGNGAGEGEMQTEAAQTVTPEQMDEWLEVCRTCAAWSWHAVLAGHARLDRTWHRFHHAQGHHIRGFRRKFKTPLVGTE
jgi:hypothetical protein